MFTICYRFTCEFFYKYSQDIVLETIDVYLYDRLWNYAK
jgi:hypothetical protein